MPALVPANGFEALASVDTFCVNLKFNRKTTEVSKSGFSYPLQFLGFKVVKSGCDARLQVAFAARPASPAQYAFPSGNRICYLDSRRATATAKLVVGGEVLGRWKSKGRADAPSTTSSSHCPGPRAPVDVWFMEAQVARSWLGPVFGKAGRAAVAIFDENLPRFVRILVDGDGRSVDGEVMALWVHDLQDASPYSRVSQVHDLVDKLGADGQSPPTGIEVLVPLLLQSITDPDMPLEDWQAEHQWAWEDIAWITGIEEEDPDAVWAWYKAAAETAERAEQLAKLAKTDPMALTERLSVMSCRDLEDVAGFHAQPGDEREVNSDESEEAVRQWIERCVSRRGNQ
jgi:hypothetical protein